MLIAIAGSGGCGKSTVLNKLKDLGYNTIQRKTSRSILSDWNIDLEEINSDPELSIKFQLEIIKRKCADEYIAQLDGSIWFTERTFADLFVYQLVSLGNLNSYSSFINEYYNDCIKKQQSYDKVFYLRSGLFTPEHDGVRGSNVHYSRMIDLTMLDITKRMTRSDKVVIVDTPCIEQRITTILAHSGLL